MNISLHSESGFSFLEILLVAGLSVFLALAGVLSFNQVKRREELFSVAARTVQLLETARAKSIANENDATWKVVIGSNQVSLQDDKSHLVETYRFPEAYMVSGPISEVVFQRIDGFVEECLNNCLFEVKEVSGNLTHEFEVLFSGAVEY